VVLSDEDVTDPALIEKYASQTRVLVVTTGAAGCTIYASGRRSDFPVHPSYEVDPTGAGDIFAAAFFTRLHATSDLETSARFANCVAASSVTRVGLFGTPTPDEVNECRRIFAG
jgi:sugar/nucleoside kinase (ribokinase family)